jgi:NitT/TauT family transport system permease protein
MPGRIIFWAAPLLVPVLFFIVWESMATLVGNSLILPPLEEIGALLAHPLDNVIAMGTLAGNIGISLVRVLCGYAAAVLLGVPLGVAMGYYASPAQSFSGHVPPHPASGLGTAGAGLVRRQ